ncbi:hypothetical protein [Iningainema tapete]|nr:hypothetical protein [Iningainema tapete]
MVIDSDHIKSMSAIAAATKPLSSFYAISDLIEPKRCISCGHIS